MARNFIKRFTYKLKICKIEMANYIEGKHKILFNYMYMRVCV